MKRKLMIQGGITMAMLLVLAFGIGVGQAYATTGCFTDTNGHWAETFICWMKDNGITTGTGGGNYSPEDNVTRAQMAVFMQKLDELAISQANLADAANLTAAKAYADASDATNLAAAKAYADTADATNLAAANAYTDTSFSTGQILISAGLGNWKPYFSSDPITFAYEGSGTSVSRSITGYNYLSIHPDLPTVLYGKNLMLTGVEFCYAASANAVLTNVSINQITNTSGGGELNIVFSDGIARTDIACRLYTLTTPVVLTAEDSVSFFIEIYWPSPSAMFTLGRTTFILTPTTTTAAPPSAPQTFGTGQ